MLNDDVSKYFRYGEGIAFENIMKIILTEGNSSFVIKNNNSQQIIKQLRKLSAHVGFFYAFQSEDNYDFLQ